MKQTSEPAVQPRRNLLTALGMWAVGLWTSTKAWASAPSCNNQDPELTMFVGRLCIDTAFREKFFGTTYADDNAAIDDTEMVKRKDIRDSLEKIRKAKKASKMRSSTGSDPTAMSATTSGNPIDEACAKVYDALSTAKALMPCNPWPC